ncbi:branched-chain-amino-acid transaminase [Paenibacillus thiaminolyticus]|uniref:Branched-chain-amino-acid aminotransferase n=1 Tax=Paenibacillus thiaminolyticus TaxID=49283 RepID=A0AAP9DYG3_PANTH|nr:branched-chain-amino-acid transaminase [Paenibacillus thiaminolyticus]MCY9535701.1 branched-chain-amino-acid transaminase [Paenibacillus thiaminolyticus]MCY9599993.1 branched-chain-amino-acid transaminase [Paenibacillus thiaminolyticus]MCY9610451.1 branched-chain-amino-acid transaminase [Paenibacillus thiaminolyticus]MCY9615682.1 branched-chain-amino-acid transaminase [Paenibacillus thiaminolyticus]MCY9617046.1 branched-chain-amino-acid transaminase [Paenibacillus thiaminolyticus]
MSQWIYLNGQYVTKENATISVYDHGFLYGDGIFEGIRVYSGNIFKCREHLERLYDSAKSIMLDIPLTLDEMQDAMVETIRRNELRDGYIRLIVSRGAGNLGLDPRRCPQASVIIIVEQLAIYPEEAYRNGLRTVSVSQRRNIPDALNPKIKSLNYLNNILVKIQANLADVGEAIMLNAQGYVAEGSSDNIFVIKKGVVYTPPCYLGALEGITRAAIMELCGKLGYTLKEEPFTLHDVYVADEVFFTGTAAEVIAVREVDGRIIGSGQAGPMTLNLLKHFREIVTQDGVKVYE